MKRIVYLMVLAVVAGSCAMYKSLDLNSLTTGMTKAEVRAIVGPPDRILAVNNTEKGYQEVLEYRTSRNEVYALEFWNDYLTGYEFLYDDVNYVPSVVPPMWYPEPGRPIIPPGYYPNRPNRPSQPNRPNRPSQPSTPSRPNRPSQPSRPEQPSRPSGDKSDLTRPTPGVGPSTSQPSTTRPSTRPAPTPSTDRSGLAK